jgi:hypothetical protein
MQRKRSRRDDLAALFCLRIDSLSTYELGKAEKEGFGNTFSAIAVYLGKWLLEVFTMKKKQETIINVTVKTIPHPQPQRAIDLMARIVLNEVVKLEAGAPFLPPFVKNDMTFYEL